MAITRELRQFDAKTGEVIEDGFVAMVMPKRRNGFGEGWFAMSQEALAYLADKVRSGNDYRVLMMLLARLDFENLICINQAEVAQALDMKAPNVNRSIKSLVSRGVLLEGPKIGRSKTYRLNPSFGWKGSAKNHQSALRDRMRAAGLSVVTGGAPEQ